MVRNITGVKKRLGVWSLVGITATGLASLGILIAMAEPVDYSARKPVKIDYAAIATQVVDRPQE